MIRDIMMNEVLLLVFFIFVSAFSSGSEIAFMSIPEMRIDYLVRKGNEKALILSHLRERKEKLLITILILNNIANIAASAIATKIALDMFGNAGIGIATGVMTFILLLFSEITPKSYCANHAEKVALSSAFFLKFLMNIFSPLTFVFDWILKLLEPFIKAKKVKKGITEDEIKNIIDKSQKHGTIKADEREMINNIFRFDDIAAEDIMIPRTSIFAIDSDVKIKDILPTIIKKGFSRIPVYEKKLDKVVGVLFVKDILNANKNHKVKNYIRDIMVVPESKKINDLFKEMKKSRNHIAIVVDEYGIVQGLVTIEDLIEEIVGEIYDETDKVKSQIKKLSKDKFEVAGDTEINEIEKKLKINLSDDGYETISSIILDKLGRIPKKNDSLELNGIKVKIKSIKDNMIRSVILEK